MPGSTADTGGRDGAADTVYVRDTYVQAKVCKLAGYMLKGGLACTVSIVWLHETRFQPTGIGRGGCMAQSSFVRSFSVSEQINVVH